MRYALLLPLTLLLPSVLAAQTSHASAAAEARRATPATAQVLRASPASGTIRIDGVIDETAWTTAEIATGFTESFPNAGGAARQRTEARVLYGNGALYVAMRMYDTAPDSIVAPLARRDVGGLASDWAHVMIDSYHDRRTAFRFSVNPRGVKRDVYHFNDGSEDASWDAVWDVATQVDSLGWTAEFRIPLSQLRFAGDEPAGGRVWGLQLMRDVARYESRDSWSPWARNDNGFVSRFGTLTGLEGLAAPQRMEIRPYSVARLTRAPASLHGGAANPFYRENRSFAAVGADLQVGIGSNLTLTATVNPDFGQVEADPSQVNLTANESFFAERRPFFQEGSDIFRFGIALGDGNSEELFYSRRIGRVPQRSLSLPEGGYQDADEATTIYGALKLSGRTQNGWSFGVLNAVTAEAETRYRMPGQDETLTATTEPMSNYAVARARRDFRNGNSTLGAIATSVHRNIGDEALDFLPTAAYSGGVDGRHRFADGGWELSGYLLGSHVTGDTLAIQRRQLSPLRYFQRPDAAHVEYDPNRTSLSGMAGRLAVGKIGGQWRGGGILMTRSPEFEVNDLGFQNEADMISGVLWAGYLQNKPGRIFRNWNLFTNHYGGTNWDGERTFTGMNLNGSFQVKNFWGGWVGVERSFEALSTGALRGGPAMVRPGGSNMWGGVHSDRRKPVSLQIDGSGRIEDETDGYSYNLGTSVTVRPSARTDLSLRPSVFRAHQAWQWVAARNDAAAGRTQYVRGELDQTTFSLTARVNYTFTPTLSLQLYAQPFIASGEYGGFMEVVDPRAKRFEDRVRPLAADELRACGGAYGVRPTGDGCGSEAGFAYRFSNPDFNVRQFRSNAVVRWEYRPGSALFFVWQQNRDGFDPNGRFDFSRDLDSLVQAPATNTFLIKGTYWIGR
jgi:hypothetical protein